MVVSEKETGGVGFHASFEFHITAPLSAFHTNFMEIRRDLCYTVPV